MRKDAIQHILNERSLIGDRLNSKNKILSKAKTLFANEGFSKVSMRSLAKELGISVASIYYYFPDKNTLYLETIQYGFADKATAFSKVWGNSQPAKKKLEGFVQSLLQELMRDLEFHRLMLRELINADPARMKMLADDVFKEQFCYLLGIMKEIAPKNDSHLLAISVLSLCKHHVEMQPLSQHLLGWKPEHKEPELLAKHIMDLLLNGLDEDKK